MKLISGSSNKPLADSISEELDLSLAQVQISAFSDGETRVEINENMRGEDVFVIQSTSFPANEHIMELLITIDALRRSSAKRITAVIPYYGYARQDSKPGPRTPITAKLVANLLSSSGADRVLTIDLHARQIQGFFDIPCDNLMASPGLVKDIRKRFGDEDLLIVSPDVGGVARARSLAKKINARIAIIDKRREQANVSEVMNIIGEVKDKKCIIVDDMADTCGTLCNAADALMAAGAVSVDAYVTHGVLSGNAYPRIEESKGLQSLTITNTINQLSSSKKVRTVSMSKLFAQAIRRIHEDSSVSILFT